MQHLQNCRTQRLFIVLEQGEMAVCQMTYPTLFETRAADCVCFEARWWWWWCRAEASEWTRRMRPEAQRTVFLVILSYQPPHLGPRCPLMGFLRNASQEGRYQVARVGRHAGKVGRMLTSHLKHLNFHAKNARRSCSQLVQDTVRRAQLLRSAN